MTSTTITTAPADPFQEARLRLGQLVAVSVAAFTIICVLARLA